MTDDRLKIWINLIKTILVSCVIAISLALINKGLREREIALEEQKHLVSFREDAITKDPAHRKRLAEFYSKLTTSEKLRKGWEDYLELVSTQQKEVAEAEFKVAKLTTELQSLRKENITDKTKIADLVNKLEVAKKELQSVRERLSYTGADRSIIVVRTDVAVIVDNNKVRVNAILGYTSGEYQDIITGTPYNPQMHREWFESEKKMWPEMIGVNLNDGRPLAEDLVRNQEKPSEWIGECLYDNCLNAEGKVVRVVMRLNNEAPFQVHTVWTRIRYDNSYSSSGERGIKSGKTVLPSLPELIGIDETSQEGINE